MAKTFACPKCGRILRQSGEITEQGGTFPTFQCDECLVNTDLLGVPVEMALTFAVDAQGRAFDPASPDGKLPL